MSWMIVAIVGMSILALYALTVKVYWMGWVDGQRSNNETVKACVARADDAWKRASEWYESRYDQNLKKLHNRLYNLRRKYQQELREKGALGKQLDIKYHEQLRKGLSTLVDESDS